MLKGWNLGGSGRPDFADEAVYSRASEIRR
jgi:hypothetical protein